MARKNGNILCIMRTFHFVCSRRGVRCLSAGNHMISSARERHLTNEKSTSLYETIILCFKNSTKSSFEMS